MNKNYLFVILGFVIVVIVMVAVLYPKEKAGGELDSFAQCLASKGITMYGAEWCSNCQNEKNRFGNSFRLVPYVECPADPKRCLSAGVAAYPTWIFPDDKKLVGEQGLQKLSDESGCPLPAQK